MKLKDNKSETLLQALNVCKEALSSLPSPEEYANILQWDTSDIFMENLRFSIDRIVDVVNCRAFRGLKNYVDETPDIKLYAKYIPEIKDFADETWSEGYDGLIESGESFWYFYNETAGNGLCGFEIVDRLSIIEEYDNIIVEEIDEDAKLSWNKEEPREAAYHVIESDNDEMIEWAADAIGNELVFFLNGYYEGCEGMYILFNSKTLGKFVEWSKSASIEPVHQPLVDEALKFIKFSKDVSILSNKGFFKETTGGEYFWLIDASMYDDGYNTSYLGSSHVLPHFIYWMIMIDLIVQYINNTYHLGW